MDEHHAADPMETRMLEEILASGAPDGEAPDGGARGGARGGEAPRVAIRGAGALPAALPVTALASAAVAAAGLGIADWCAAALGERPDLVVDRRLASLGFGSSLRPIGWAPPPPWDPIAGDYRTADGWIRLHTNVPAHRAAALVVLDAPADRERVAAAVVRWRAEELESAVHLAGGCAAAMRTAADWQASAPGRSVAVDPVIRWAPTAGRADLDAPRSGADRARPLRGIRVLDLTRVLAGPIATRLLAHLGAEVLRIDPPDWDEPGVVPEVMPGKRTARLDLRRAEGRERLLDLLSDAEVLVHGYRPGALDGLGLGATVREDASPGLVEARLSAYGWSGPWAARRGFDSLVQMSTGIAEAGMRVFGRERPIPLPVQALDHATGFLLARAAVQGLARRARTGRGSRASLSLARTAELLAPHAPIPPGPGMRAETAADLAPGVERTAWGPARRLRQPLALTGVSFEAELPAREIGSDAPRWR
ncbi:CoA transferase [Leucobacter allii]|uniref:CoA transferase n=1 Tax=Leucobacter allii TaxID=2932247 RepID=UPI001FD4CF69|nr:CoA transferase [Leucobacter allii]UOR00461.1 CoA transferase [Leucobacter allii]